MTTSESVKEIFTALVRAQASIPSVRRDSENSHLGTKYADLAAIYEAVRKPLADNSLALVQTSEDRRELTACIVVVTTLIHASGEWIESELLMPLGDKDPRKSAAQQGRRRLYLRSAPRPHGAPWNRRGR